MRASIKLSLCLAAAVSATSALAGPVRISPGEAVRALPSQIRDGYMQRLRDFRRDALAQQRDDGGTLSPVHKAAFQVRLDRINARFNQQLRNNNPLAVDANGNPTRSVSATRDWTHAPVRTTGILN